MKPKLFIGSSKEGLSVANAIHTALSGDSECTVWKYAFPLSGNTLSSIMEAARASDFGVFVFTPDDVTQMRGDSFLVARDNVLYELGLFSGHLSPSRCFFVLPDSIRVHIVGAI
jgi:predicted nucleotide-binding protein